MPGMPTSRPSLGRRALLALPLATGAAVAGCTPDGSTAPPSESATSSASPSHPATTGARRFVNPLYDHDFPDPFILATDDGYIAYATNGDLGNIQTLTSPDLRTWTPGKDAMPQVAAWTSTGMVWAPEVATVGESYLMYYTTAGPGGYRQSISIATAEDPHGPFVDKRSGPLVWQQDAGGSIDASPYLAPDGRRYLFWKNDGNAVSQDTWLWVQRLNDAGSELVDQPKKLFKQTLEWEGHLIEAPFCWEVDGTYFLFYSANDYGSPRYAVGYATASSPAGPYVKHGKPILVTDDDAAGPGHCALIRKGDDTWMIYHAWPPNGINGPTGREPWLSAVDIRGKEVRVDPPQHHPKRHP